jgi:hypothetical protein
LISTSRTWNRQRRFASEDGAREKREGASSPHNSRPAVNGWYRIGTAAGTALAHGKKREYSGFRTGGMKFQTAIALVIEFDQHRNGCFPINFR